MVTVPRFMLELLFLRALVHIPQRADLLDPGAIEPANHPNCQNIIVIESDDSYDADNGTHAARFSVLYYDTSAEHGDGYDADNEDNHIDASCFTGQYSLGITSIEHDDSYNAD